MAKFNPNKLLVIVFMLCAVFALNGCNNSLQKNDDTEVIQEAEETSEENEELIAKIEELEDKIASIEDTTYNFSIYPEGYLMNEDQKYLSKPMAEWIGGDDYNVGIWFERDEGENHYIYFATGTDCGGCVSNSPVYLIKKKNQRAAERHVLNDKDDNGGLYPIFERGNFAYLLSPHKTKAAFVGAEDIYNFEDTGKQTIYIYDFNTEKTEVFMELPADKKIAGGFDGFEINTWDSEVDMYWDIDTGDLVVNF